jgi:hypothetical protein
MVLGTHANELTHECFCGHQRICDEANMGYRNVVYTIKKLEELGELTVIRGTGRGNLTKYKINLPIIEKMQSDAPFDSFSSEPLAEERVQSTASFSQTDPGERVQSSVKRMQGIAPLKDAEDCTLSEKGCNPSSERVQSSVEKGAKSGGAYKEMEPHGTIREPEEESSATFHERIDAIKALITKATGQYPINGKNLKFEEQAIAINKAAGLGSIAALDEFISSSRGKALRFSFFAEEFCAWHAARSRAIGSIGSTGPPARTISLANSSSEDVVSEAVRLIKQRGAKSGKDNQGDYIDAEEIV